MPVAIGQTESAEGTSPTLTGAFPSPCVSGDLIWIAVVTASPAEPVVTYRFNGQDPGDPFSNVVDSETGLQLFQRMWTAKGGEQFIVVNISIPLVPALMFVCQITDDAHLPPYDTEVNAGTGTNPEIMSWYAVDDGIALSLVCVAENYSASPPGGWSTLLGFATDSVSGWVASRPETGGVQPPEDWTPNTTGMWVTTVVPFEDLGTRLPPCTAFTSNPGGMLLVPGRIEPPPVVVPFIPDTNPLPPQPTEIEVPLEPWLPKPGPYRDQV